MQTRLDLFVSKKEDISRSKAQNLIKEGLVFVNGEMVKKEAFLVDERDKVEIIGHTSYVSRGAYKLLGAIEKFKLELNDKVILDLGASTGGFTQVCLNFGAKKVYSVDVGVGQLASELARDPRVNNIEKTDVRDLKRDVVKDVNFVVGDLSFISLTKVLPKIKELLGTKIDMVLLFKPQFECGMEVAKKYKGIIKNKEIHGKLLKNFENFAKLLGFSINNIIISPIKGGDGNIEYLLRFGGEKVEFDIDNVVNSAY